MARLVLLLGLGGGVLLLDRALASCFWLLHGALSLLLAILLVMYEPTSNSAKAVCAGTACMYTVLRRHAGKTKSITKPATRESCSFKSRVDMCQALHHAYICLPSKILWVIGCNSESTLRSAIWKTQYMRRLIPDSTSITCPTSALEAAATTVQDRLQNMYVQAIYFYICASKHSV